MDANGTRCHLLLGEADWTSCRSAASADASPEQWLPVGARAFVPAEWNKDTCEVMLTRRQFSFTPAPQDRRPDLERDRRGAAADAFGNWYWLDATRSRIRVRSGAGPASDFWPAAEPEVPKPRGGFEPAEPAPDTRAMQLSGLAVTANHYLVAGTIDPAGLLVFDLYAGGGPQHLLWPQGIDFKPFDMAAGPGGGVWILDRKNLRYWVLDRHFNVVRRDQQDTTLEEAADLTFQPATGDTTRRVFRRTFPAGVDLDAASPVLATQPVAIEALPDGTVLILDGSPLTDRHRFASIFVYRSGHLQQELHTDPMLTEIAPDSRGDFSLIGYDMAFVPGPATIASKAKARENVNGEAVGRLYIADAGGNQGYAFDLHESGGTWTVKAVPEYLPMRRFGGRGLVTAGGMAYYDFAESWVPLVWQARPRHEPVALLLTGHFDGKEPDCVWHRLLLDACIPPDTRVRVWSRAANEKDLLDATPWSEEPPLYLRGDGPEIPFLRSPWRCTARGDRHAPGEGTWELLLQRARGRYLQLKLELSGNERSTPRLRALRVYYPRFSYLSHYLPAVYREDAPSAFFLDGFLANLEGFYTAIEDRVAAVQILFDWRSAPPEALDWLARWFGVALDPAWDDTRRRLFIRHTMLFFQYRGTAHGLRLALALALDREVDESRFAAPELVRDQRFGVRIIEKYLTRTLPDVVLGDPSQLEAPPAPEDSTPWQPGDGGAALRERYRRFPGGEPGAPTPEFPLVPPADRKAAGRWAQFAEQALRFTPWAAALEREAWQNFLAARYGDVESLNTAHGTGYTDFTDVTVPTNLPQNEAARGDWIRHARDPEPARTPLERRLWQAFLQSRYGRIGALNDKYSTAWTAFDLVPLPDRLPPDGAALADWFQFEGAVLAMRGTAHRFSVLLPMPTEPDFTPEEPQRRLDLVRRIVALEKPAHTVFDVRFYWAMFRIGEARLGLDTLIDDTARSRLIPALVLGRGYVGEGFVAPTVGEGAPKRLVIGRDRLTN